jgi:hypothetical protein
MAARRIGYRDFDDDTRRAVFEDESGQFVLDDDRPRLYGVWLLDVESEEQPRRATQENYQPVRLNCLAFLMKATKLNGGELVAECRLAAARSDQTRALKNGR